MEFAAMGAFVILFVAFVVLPKKLMNRDDEETAATTSPTVDEAAVLHLHRQPDIAKIDLTEPLAATAD